MNCKSLKKKPSKIEVTYYFFQMGLQVKHANAFYLYYHSLNWHFAPGIPVKNWKSLAFNWVRSFRKAKPITEKSIRC